MFISHNPASTNFEAEYAYPMCGLENEINEWNLSFSFSRRGRELLMMSPPIECPIIEILKLPFVLITSFSTSLAKRSPIPSISPSVLDSFEVDT